MSAIEAGGNTLVLRVRSPTASTFRSLKPLLATPDGMCIGSGKLCAVQCTNDPLISETHGTLECTLKLGIWVYVDHSTHGTLLLQQNRRLHNAAAVVQQGERIQLGETEIELNFSGDRRLSPSNQTKSVWPAPISPSLSSEGSSRKPGQSPQQAKQSIPKIVTEGTCFPSRTLEYIDSPSMNWRKKAHSVAAAKAVLSPNRAPPSGTNYYQRKNVLVPSAPSTPPRYDGTRPCTNVTLSPSSNAAWRPVNVPLSPPPPPPMPEYSSSPVTTPSFLKRLQATPATAPVNMSPHQTPPESIPKSRRDDLRIQVSKKMAGFQAAIEVKNQTVPVERLARPVAGGALGVMKITVPTTPTSQTKRGGGNNQLDFTPPASPVAHRDILRQQQTLQNVLQHKFEEEQLLKEQQEQWLRENFNYTAPTPPISPIKSHKGSPHSDLSSNQEHHLDHSSDDLWDDADDIPDRTPILLRTQSHGLHYLPSPRVAAAVRASRSRLGSLDDPARNEKVFPRTAVSRQSNGSSSVRSSASTEIACHRRVVRSLSASSLVNSSSELSDFIGYEEDMDDITSFTAHEVYSETPYFADEYKRSQDDSMLKAMQFSYSSSTNSSSHTLSGHDSASLRELITSNTPEQEDDDDEPASAMMSEVKQPMDQTARGNNLDLLKDAMERHSPYKAAKFKNQQPTEPITKPIFRRRASQMGLGL